MASRRLALAVHVGARPNAETSNREGASLTASSKSEGSMTRAVAALGASDQCVRDEAARQIWDRFAQRLCTLVRHRLSSKIRVREDENDIVQSMFQNFFAVQQTQEYHLKNRQELWRFLVWMTMCKVANTAHHHQRTRRDIRREQSLTSSEGAADFSTSMISEIADPRAISPADAAISRIELARILRRLSKDLRQILVWKLKDYTNKEIGQKIDRTERTVEVKMRLLRQTLARDLGMVDGSVAAKSTGEPHRPLKLVEDPSDVLTTLAFAR
jgi:RNA polymerase sigma-70 factor (ECF subfamily)